MLQGMLDRVAACVCILELVQMISILNIDVLSHHMVSVSKFQSIKASTDEGMVHL